MRHPMCLLFLVLLASLSYCNEVIASDDDVADIVRQIDASASETEIRAAMRELAAIDTAASSQAFVDIMEAKVFPLGLRLLPFIDAMYAFGTTSDVRNNVIELLRRFEGTDLDRYEHAYVVGLLIRHGEVDRVDWLIGEFQRSRADWNQEYYSATLLGILCRVNIEEASEFVVDHALDSGDPTIMLTAESNMRRAGNRHAIDIMRGWDRNPADFDLVAIERSLKSIIAFGDDTDREFLNWLDEWLESEGERHFADMDIESEIRPLLIQARTSLSKRSGTEDPTSSASR